MKFDNGKLVVKKWKMNSKSIFILLVAIMPLIDTLNGFILLQLNKGIGIGQIYRAILVIIALLMVSKKRLEKNFLYLTVHTILVLSTLSILHIFINNALASEISLLAQWLLTPLLLYCFYELKRGEFINKEDINKILNVYAWMVPFTIIIPKLLNIGFNTYGGNIGFKGFYYANNGISFLTSILVLFIFYKLLNEKITFTRILQISLLLFTCLLLGTKSSIISIIIAIVFSVAYSFRKGGIKGFITAILILLVLFIAAVYFQEEIDMQITRILERFNYMNSIYSDSLINSLTTGRLSKATQQFDIMKNSITYPLNILIGTDKLSIIAEIDIIDLFFAYGFIGVFVFIEYAIIWLKKVKYDNRIYKILICFSLAYSLVVGHVFNNSMSIMVFVLLLASGNLKKISN